MQLVRQAVFFLACLFLIPAANGADPTELVYPVDVAVGKDGAVYVADLKLPGVWKIQGDKKSIVFQGQKRFRTPLNAIRCVAISNDRLLAGDSATTAVYQVQGKEAAKAHEGRILKPMAMAVRKDGGVLVADLELRRIWLISPDGGKPALFATSPAPYGIAVDAEDRVWVVAREQGKQQVLRFSADGKQREVVCEGNGFRYASQIVVNGAGDAFIADGYASAIWKLPAGADTAKKLVSGAPLRHPVGLSLQGETLLVADSRARSVFAIDAKGEIKKLAGP